MLELAKFLAERPELLAIALTTWGLMGRRSKVAADWVTPCLIAIGGYGFPGVILIIRELDKCS